MPEPTVFLLDDDPAVRSSLEALLSGAGWPVAAYATAADFLAQGGGDRPGCLLLDLCLPGRDGLTLQAELAARGRPLPIIILTGHGDVPRAVQALKAGAVDFLEKPCDRETLLAAVQRALAAETAGPPAGAGVRAQAGLTPREDQVLERVVAGATTKEIAHALGISPRTAELHRARMMQKMGVRTVAALVQRLTGSDQDPLS